MVCICYHVMDYVVKFCSEMWAMNVRKDLVIPDF